MLDWSINLGRHKASEWKVTSVAINCATFTFDYVAPPQVKECTAIDNGGVSTNLAPNGWTDGAGEYVDGGYEFTAPGAWAEVSITRTVNDTLQNVLTGLDLEASDTQYLGLHFHTSDGRTIVYEEEPSYGGKLWSTSAFDGVPAGLGYAALGTPNEYAAQHAGLQITSVELLYTHPTGKTITVTKVEFGCKYYKFDLEMLEEPTVAADQWCPAEGSDAVGYAFVEIDNPNAYPITVKVTEGAENPVDVNVPANSSVKHELSITEDQTVDVKVEFDGEVVFQEAVKLNCQLTTFPDVEPGATPNPMTCTTDGSIVLFNSIDDDQAVLWTINGQPVAAGSFAVKTPGTYVVTADPNAPDYGFSFGVKDEWEFEFERPTNCPTSTPGGELPTLALTGSDSSFSWFAAAAVLLLAGLGSTVVRARRSSAE